MDACADLNASQSRPPEGWTRCSAGRFLNGEEISFKCARRPPKETDLLGACAHESDKTLASQHMPLKDGPGAPLGEAPVPDVAKIASNACQAPDTSATLRKRTSSMHVPVKVTRRWPRRALPQCP